MSTKRQIGIVIGVFLLLWWGIPLIYIPLHRVITGEMPGDNNPVTGASIVLAFGWLLLGSVYLTVGAAIRHNRRAE